MAVFVNVDLNVGHIRRELADRCLLLAARALGGSRLLLRLDGRRLRLLQLLLRLLPGLVFLLNFLP